MTPPLCRSNIAGETGIAMGEKRANARININKLLVAACWRVLPVGNEPANVSVEPSVAIKSANLDARSDTFQKCGSASQEN